LAAAWDELSEKGWRGFTMEGVAARARSGKAPLYARWSSRAALVRAALYRHAALPTLESPDAGNLRDDLVHSLELTGIHLATPFGEAVRALVSEAGNEAVTPTDDQDPIESVALLIERARRRSEPLVDGVVIRRAAADVPPAVVNLGPQVATLDFLSNGVPSSRYRVEQIVDQIWLPLLIHYLATEAS
jgi:AcrR family transcriptional regulator